MALGTVERRFDRTVEHAVDGNAILQFVERGLIDLTMGAHAVASQPAGGRQFERARQTAVIGQKQQAFGVDVEAADGENPRQAFRQVVEHGRATFRIGIGRHQATGLVVEPKTGALDAADRHAIHFDLVFQRHVDHRCIERLAVQCDATFEDHPLHVTTRSYADTGENFRNTLGLAVGRRGCTLADEFLALGRTDRLSDCPFCLGARLCRASRLVAEFGSRLA
ncbi:hypothetical protein D3C73_803640 [compost metagenome]